MVIISDNWILLPACVVLFRDCKIFWFFSSTAFEELEKALSTAQKTEEARKKLQVEMDEKIKAIEKANEEERVSLHQELTRVKQEVVNIMKVKTKTEFSV